LYRSLAERLGHDRSARLLIVNCDDLGSSHSANLATLAAMDAGVATSATLMVPCPWAREAAELFRDRDVGVHLTFTAEYPGYRWRSLTGAASLHDDDGFLPATTRAVFRRASPVDIHAEGRAQIEQSLAWGLDVTHIDSHMGVMHFDPRFFAVYLDLAEEYRLPIRHFSRPGENEGRAQAQARGIVCTDHLLAPDWPNDTKPFLMEQVAAMKPGVTETFAHPVIDGMELRAYDKAAPDVRARDAECLLDPDVKRLLADNAIVTISYRALRDLQRGSA
jgi:predicted glycoside hydrolase/deacetylase ChbG (UPF0249 family)